MRDFKSLIAIILISFFISNIAIAQNEGASVKVETKDGNVYVGRIVSEDSTTVVIETEELGQIPIKKAAITSRTKIDSTKMVKGKLWDDNPQSTRYLWTPNGYGLKKGEAYYQNIWVLYNQVSVGITDNISASIGTIPLFLFGVDVTPVWIIPKFSIPIIKDKINMGLGVFAGAVIGEENNAFGLGFGTITLGNRDKNLNIGVGWGYTPEGLAQRPLINLSGMIRVSANGYFLTENYFIPLGDNSNLVLFSAGGRYMIKKVGIDFGLYLPLSSEIGQFIAIPLLGITLPFGRVANK
ncbi:MAG TPA: hypothetical protein PK076_00495 [Saprospiraceae bacterium]|nr:hypothetical protein [Saprospiraceae bacterium]